MTADSDSKKPSTATVVLVVMIVLVLVVIAGPRHLFYLASNAEYRRCWALVEKTVPDGFTVRDVRVSGEEIRWEASSWDGDKYLFASRICKRGSYAIENSALD